MDWYGMYLKTTKDFWEGTLSERDFREAMRKLRVKREKIETIVQEMKDHSQGFTRVV